MSDAIFGESLSKFLTLRFASLASFFLFVEAKRSSKDAGSREKGRFSDLAVCQPHKCTSTGFKTTHISAAAPQRSKLPLSFFFPKIPHSLPAASFAS